MEGVSILHSLKGGQCTLTSPQETLENIVMYRTSLSLEHGETDLSDGESDGWRVALRGGSDGWRVALSDGWRVALRGGATT